MRRLVSRVLLWVPRGAMALLALVAVAIELVSWNFLRAPIENRFAAATGRSLSIDGDLSLSLLPRSGATASALTLENPDWAAAPGMLEIERISVRPSLWAALRASLTFREKSFDPEAHADSLRRLTGSVSGFSGELSMHTEGGGLNAGFDLAGAPQLVPAQVNLALELQDLAEWSRWAGQPAVHLQTL